MEEMAMALTQLGIWESSHTTLKIVISVTYYLEIHCAYLCHQCKISP